MSTDIVHREHHDGGVAVLRLDRPPVNALNPAFLAEIDHMVDALRGDTRVHALVIAGTGKTLSGGMDLKELQTFTIADQRAMVTGLNTTFASLYGFPKPVICAAHGAAIAGGMFFVLVSDYRIAGDRAQFGLAEVRVGVRFPVGPFEIARSALSPDACRRFMLSGRNHDASTALALGAVDEVVPGDQVLARALEVAAEYARIPPHTFAHTKKLLRGDVLNRIAASVAGGAEPMLAGWFTDETAVATQAMLASLRR